ncbi:MAG: DUF1549 domain-containing protein, partial [Planctomycetaceae bacterium]|nr:DUF1549 domain-containing protein [Planctomycetaceae bacterium]
MKASLFAALSLLFSGGTDPHPLDAGIAAINSHRPEHLSGRSDDAEFLRRLSLDLLGYPPAAEEVLGFLDDPAPDKRAKKIDDVLSRPRFADFWARRFAEVYFGNYHQPVFDIAPGLTSDTRRRLLRNFIAWLREEIDDDRPWPQIVRAMITARGSTATTPQLAYKLSFYGDGHRQELKFAEGIPRHFLGINLQCARCHDHPFDRWRTEHLQGFGAFNTRQRAVRRVVEGVEQVEVHYDDAGEWTSRDAYAWTEGERAFVYPPRFLEFAAPACADRADTLAAMMIGDPERRLSLSLGNRVWGWLIGRGVFEPVDDLNILHRPASQKLARALIQVTGMGSLREVVRGVCLSEAYQRPSAATARCD